jgi:Xaa-Pro aminopeptidase
MRCSVGLLYFTKARRNRMDTFDFREFPQAEFELRCRKARDLMSEKGIDWLIVSDYTNFRYFTGCMPATRNRPGFFFLPLVGNPFILAATFSIPDFRLMSWIPDIAEYRVPINAEKIRDALIDAGVRKARVGTEQNDALFGGFHMSLQCDEFIQLKQMMQDCEFVDASNILWTLRIKKTDFEVECLRKACDITSKAYEHMFHSVHAGMTELDASRLLIEGMMLEGADYPTQYRGSEAPCSFIIADATRPLGQPHMPVNKVMREGDVLHIDTGAVYRGYHADFARLGVVGKPNDKQIRLWEESVNPIRRSLQKIKPGNPLGEIEIHWHGIGLDLVEYPFVECDKDKIMTAGMVLGLENLLYDEIGSFHLEDNIVVTESGYELLSKVKTDLFEIQ